MNSILQEINQVQVPRSWDKLHEAIAKVKSLYMSLLPKQTKNSVCYRVVTNDVWALPLRLYVENEKQAKSFCVNNNLKYIGVFDE